MIPRSPRPPWLACQLIAGVAMFLQPKPTTAAAPANVAVVANSTQRPLRFAIESAAARAETFELAPGETRPLRFAGTVTLGFRARGAAQRFPLSGGAVYAFAPQAEGVAFEQIALVDPATAALETIAATAAPTERQAGRLAPPTPGVLRVKVLVDDEEVSIDRRWQARLARRVAAVSAVIEQHCFMRVEIESFDRWESRDDAEDFEASLNDFTKVVDPSPARLVIGFASQYNQPQGSTRLGGIRGPFQTHLLIREWPQHVSEAEREEVLLHELAHYFGAVHSSDPTSAVRPSVGDRQANAKKFRLACDPLNILAMNLVAEEIRTRQVDQFTALSPATREALVRVYLTVAKRLPNDPAAWNYIQRLGLNTTPFEARFGRAPESVVAP